MNKKVVIIGALVLLGGGAFFYFKTKAKPKTDTTGSGTAGTGTSGSVATDTSGAGTTGTNTTPVPTDTILNTAPIVNPDAPITNAQSAQNMEALAKFTQAQGLATQIVNLRSGIKPAIFQFGGDMQTYMRNMAQNGQIQGEISNIATQMGALGYKEVNGVATKM